MKKIKNKIFRKAGLSLLILIMLAMSAAQGFVQIKNLTIYTPQIPPMQRLDDPFYTWEDLFNTEENIDPYYSYDYELVSGVIQMKNTYSIWTDPSWSRMKPIQLSNTAGEPLANYAIKLTLEHESEMQDDYDDIRFKHEDSTSWLDYWIESQSSTQAIVWVKIPVIPAGTSNMYLFYGNPSAQNQSDFYSVFTDWIPQEYNDFQISFHGSSAGAFDPDVEFGSNKFLVAWEQGTMIFIQKDIRATIYNINGAVAVPEFTIFSDNLPITQFRNGNPSIAFSGSKFFVAWQHYQPGHVSDPSTMDIKGRTVTPSGELGSVIDICTASNCQADSNVQYDSVNDRFCVVWEDARNGQNNYNIYGRLYDSNGSSVGDEKTISSAANSQCEPWVAFDTIHEQYMIIYEEGLTPDMGPFSIKAGIYDENLNQVGSTINIITGNTDTDYNFPCVEFSEDAQRYLLTWNDGDISDEDYRGDVWGRIVDYDGDTIVDNYLIKSGNFERTDIVNYLSSSFFVSFDNKGDIFGKLVLSDGQVVSGDIQLSASNSAVADWANMAVGAGKIFVTWEDERIVNQEYPSVYGNIWNLNIPTGSEVTYSIGTEKQIILNAKVTSKVISPSNLLSWYQFGVTHSGSIVFNIIDSNGVTLLLPNVGDGEDLSGINPVTHPGIRVQGVFSRTDPSYSPTLDSWKVIYVGLDEEPPDTEISNIDGPLGLNGWYLGNVKIELSATDGQYGSGVNHTYFKIDAGGVQVYDESVGIKIPLNATGDPNSMCGDWNIYYWSVDKAENVESMQGPQRIKIDKAPPYVTIWDPPDRANVYMYGNFWVQAAATDECSGIDYVEFDVGPPYESPTKVETPNPAGSDNYKWLCDYSVNKFQWRHIIAIAHDNAGLEYEANIYVYFPRTSHSPMLRLLKILDVLDNLGIYFRPGPADFKILELLQKLIR
jgi:hypothetical protein